MLVLPYRRLSDPLRTVESLEKQTLIKAGPGGRHRRGPYRVRALG